MFGRNSTDGWMQAANRIQNTTCKVSGLTSGVSYYFAVRAENSHGISGPSVLSEPITVGVVSCFTINLLREFLCVQNIFLGWKFKKVIYNL